MFFDCWLVSGYLSGPIVNLCGEILPKRKILQRRQSQDPIFRGRPTKKACWNSAGFSPETFLEVELFVIPPIGWPKMGIGRLSYLYLLLQVKWGHNRVDRLRRVICLAAINRLFKRVLR